MITYIAAWWPFADQRGRSQSRVFEARHLALAWLATLGPGNWNVTTWYP